jgi:hypothetical protein
MKKWLFAFALFSCSEPAEMPKDMSVAGPDFAGFMSDCGKPGDVGNSIGIGKFCIKQSDCNPGTVCTQLGDPNNYFCTKSCTAGDAGVETCGENAHCACDPQGRGCGCFPDACN